MDGILITGIGLTSKILGAFLTLKGYDVRYLTRNPNKYPKLKAFKWNLALKQIDLDAFKNVKTLIHLAGAGISEKRWTAKRKQEIFNSLILSTKLLFETVKLHNIKLDTFIGASAIGYYGAITSEKVYTENDNSANDFLGKTCAQWEEELLMFNAINIRTVILRTGVVFSKKGGAFDKIIFPIKKNIGASLYNGAQYLPWIHMKDLIQMYFYCIQYKNISGIYNAVSPEHISNEQITESIAKKLNKKIWLPNIPKFMLSLIFGQMASILIYGSRVSSKKIIDSGFKFKYMKLDDALDDLLQH